MNAIKSLTALTNECHRLGVKFISGPAGTVLAPIFTDGTKIKVAGVQTQNGALLAETVVLACGAWLPTMLDTDGQVVAKAWTLAHLQLSPEEAVAFKNAPVINNRELGYFFEPQNGRLKIAPQLPGVSCPLPSSFSLLRLQAHQPPTFI